MRPSWKILFAAFLIGLSVLLYALHFWIFRDSHHIFIYLLGDIAFVPIDVLLVALILEHILESKNRQQRLAKLNMVIDAFFSEVGSPLLRLLDVIRCDNPQLGESVALSDSWTDKDFARAKSRWSGTDPSVRAGTIDFLKLRTFLSDKRPFLLGLLENPTLLEHDAATDMLWALFHLTEELIARPHLERFSQADQEHLAGDIHRAYRRVGAGWIDHMRHLKKDYPYLFSLSLRINPFRPGACAEVT